MAKKRIFMMVTFLVMLVFTVSAYAVTYSKEEKQRGKVYTIDKSGSNSNFIAVGTKTEAYTTVTSKATYEAHMTALVQSYERGTQNYTRAQDAKTVKPGFQVFSGKVARKYTNNTYEYYYSGSSYSTVTPGSWSRVDTYSYKAKQYDD